MGAGHPYTKMILNNLSCYLRGAGDLEEACEISARVVPELAESLGGKPDHPWVLSAIVNLANCLGDAGRYEQAEELERTTLDKLVRSLGDDHPDSNACRSNLAITLEGRGLLAEAAEHREVAVNGLLVLAENHPHPSVEDARAGVRLNRDLELQPL